MKYIAFDTETTGLNPWLGAKVFAFSTCDEDENVEVWRLDGKDGVDPAKGFHKLRWMIDAAVRGEICLVMANAKFDLRMTEACLGFHFAEDIDYHDVLLQSHVLRSNHPTHKLKDLAWELGGIPLDDENAIKPYVKGLNAQGEEVIDFSRVPPKLMHEYQRQDAIRTMLLHLFFLPKLQANPTWLELYQDEIDLVLTTLRMEERGILLRRQACIDLADGLEQDAARVLDDCEAFMGKRIDLGNDNRIRELLYEDLGFPVLKATKTGKACVDKETLRELGVGRKHPVFDFILQYKSWSRGATTLRSYLTFADKNDVVHPDIRTCGAGTGRESCSKPNLQNVAKEKSYLSPFPIPARRAFRPRPGYVNFHIDYSGIEFRLAVILTGDKQLLDLVVAGEDLHVIGARILFGEDKWDRATDEERAIMRGAGKNANFAKMYGAGVAKVSATIGQKVTRATFKRYDTIFGALDKSARRIVDFAKRHGYVETIHGRRLYVPAHKPYAGTNYKIQGSAAEILKRAQNRVHRYLEEATDGRARLLLPIHDELVLEWPRAILYKAPIMLAEVRELMIDFPKLGAPLDVDVEVVTHDWSKKKGFEICATRSRAT